MMFSMMSRMTPPSQSGMFQSNDDSDDSYDYDYDYDDGQSSDSSSSPLAAIMQSLLAHIAQPEPSHPHVEIAFKEPVAVPAPAAVEISPAETRPNKQEVGPKDQISYRSAP